mgnify:CR=1 FL=1
MAGLKYSKQRASIKDYLMHTTSHPTADTVYLHIKEEFPNISLGTVYRNLNLLSEISEKRFGFRHRMAAIVLMDAANLIIM